MTRTRKRYNPVPPLVVGSLIGLGLALLHSCTVGPAQTFNTHTGQWENAPVPSSGMCGDRPCTDEELQQPLDGLDPLEDTHDD